MSQPADQVDSPLLTGSEDQPALLTDVVEAELEYILQQRHSGKNRDAVRRTLVGLALSGGGIRSATTNLGVLQALSRMDILPMVDYVSTVSGGGYIGACLTSLLTDRAPGAAANDPCPESMHTASDAPGFSTRWENFPLRAEYDTQRRRPVGAELVAHLRTHGNFLIARWGLLRRETMRSIGNLLTGVTYSVLLFLLTLFTASALYLTIAWLIAPGLLHRLDSMTPRPESNRSASALREGDSVVTRVRAAACQGEPGCGIETRTTLQAPTLLQRTMDNTRMVAAPFAGAWNQWRQQGWHLAPQPFRAVLTGFAVGAIAALVILGLFGKALQGYVSGRARRTRVLKAGESDEDVFERRVLLCLAAALLVACVGTLLWFGRERRSGLEGPSEFALLLVPFAVLAGTRLASLLLAILWLPRMGLWTRRMRSLWGAFQAITIFGWWITLALAVLPLLIYAVRDHTLTVGLGAVGSLVITRLLTSRVGMPRRRVVLPTGLRHALLGVAVAAVIGLGLLFFAVVIASATAGASGVAWFLIPAGVLLVLFAIFANPNRLSPHYFYQDRLAETYLFSEVADDRGGMRLYRDAMEMPLRCLHDARGKASGAENGARAGPRNPAPYHLISAAINLAGSKDLTRKDRKSGYWLFSKLYCGSTHTGFRPTEVYEGGNTKVARAIAISGAAASSAVGQDTFFAQAFATVLFNIRLGYWMDNPRHRHGPLFAWWPLYLLSEVVMNTTERSRLVNLSDGGHTGDNVGIYPLLQRRCKVIIACDAERDPGLTFGSFTEALRHAYVDMGIDVDIDLTMMRADPATGATRTHCSVGRIRYPDRPDQESFLVYLKNSLTGDEPEPVLNYKSRFPDFPHESTADQFFDDAQFESYRALGVHLAEHTFGRWIISRWFPEARRQHGPTRGVAHAANV